MTPDEMRAAIGPHNQHPSLRVMHALIDHVERLDGAPESPEADILERLRDHADGIRREACAVLECNDDVDAQWLQRGHATELLLIAAADEIERLNADLDAAREARVESELAWAEDIRKRDAEIERWRRVRGSLVQPSMQATGIVLQALSEGRVRLIPKAT